MWTRFRSVEHMRTLLRERPAESPSPIHLLVDTRADGVRIEGVARERLLLLDLTGGEDLTDDAGIRYRHVVDGGRVSEAFLPWDSVFCVVAPADASGTRAVLVHAEAVPPDLAKDRAKGLAILLAALDLDRSRIGELRPFAVAMSVEAFERLAPERFEPEKRRAFQRLLDEVRPRPFALHVDPHAPGVQLGRRTVAPGIRRVSLEVSSSADIENLRVTGVHVRFKAYEQGHKHSVVVPWGAISAIQDPATLRGWFWPTDLPEVEKQDLLAGGFGHLLAARGVPFLTVEDVFPDDGMKGPRVERLVAAPATAPAAR